MPGKWSLEVEPHSPASSGYLLSLQWKDSNTGQSAEVASCQSLDEMEKQISSFKSEMDELLRSARDRIREVENPHEKEPVLPPEQIWLEMERCASEEGMFAYFNSLDRQTREKVAGYVFSKVNMFRGRGPAFAEHYDSSSHTLE